MVLQGSRSVDLYVAFCSLRENLRKESTESLYFLFTNWRITKNNKSLKELVSSLVNYVQAYFSDFDHDPDMQWLWQGDHLADDIVATNQISKFEMLQ